MHISSDCELTSTILREWRTWNENQNFVRGELWDISTYESFEPLATTFVVTLIVAIFGTIIYFRPATIATDCGGDVTLASNDCVMFVEVSGTRVDPPLYKLLLSSFEFRLAAAAAAADPVLEALLPLCNTVAGPVVLLFRDDRSRCFVVAVINVTSDPNWLFPTAGAITVANSVGGFCCASAAANSAMQRCFIGMMGEKKGQEIRKWDSIVVVSMFSCILHKCMCRAVHRSALVQRTPDDRDTSIFCIVTAVSFPSLKHTVLCTAHLWKPYIWRRPHIK